VPRGTRPFRLLIQEHEVFQRDVPGSQQRRLVYGDILDL
jgi:hypothetical protein